MIDYSDIVSALSEALTTPSLSRELVSSLSRSAPNFGEVRLLSDGLALGPFKTIKNYLVFSGFGCLVQFEIPTGPPTTKTS